MNPSLHIQAVPLGFIPDEHWVHFIVVVSKYYRLLVQLTYFKPTTVLCKRAISTMPITVLL